MGRILLLALAAAVYPQLLAVVAVVLTRPSPRPLLWACWLGSLVVSIGGSALIFAVFRSRGTIGGTSSQRLDPAAYLVIGGIALLFAIAVGSRRGRELIGRDLPTVSRRQGRRGTESGGGGLQSRAELALRGGSVAVAGVVGAVLAIPGPFDLLALGHLARGSYGALVAGVAIVVFALIKFLLIEIPIVSYALDPEGTSAKVGRFSAWMKANKMAIIAGIVGVIGVVLIGQGISTLP